MAAPVDLVEVDEVGVDLFDPAARGPPDLAGEGGEADRNRDLRQEPARTRVLGRARPLSQYARAAEAPVPVSQYSVMLSTIVLPGEVARGLPSTKAREIL